MNLSHSLLKPLLATGTEEGCCCFNRRARNWVIKISEKIVKEPSPHGITLSLVGRKVTVNEASSAEAPEMVELEHLPCKEKASGAAKTLSSTYLEIIKETEPRLFSGAG